MRFALLIVLSLCVPGVLAQKAESPEIAAPKPAAKDDEKKKPAPRVTVRQKGGVGSNVGDDAPGGGATSAPGSKGGTPGGPSGSFTGPGPGPR
jgi:hypothetical protein